METLRIECYNGNMTTILLDIPDKTMEQAQQAAAALKRPLEAVLTDLLVAAVPSVSDAPAEIQADLMRMTWFDNQTLWQIAQESMPMELQEEMRQLVQLQEDRLLTSTEEAQLGVLRQTYGQITLRKARAYALLSLRGGQPLL
jgi:hypothetical protein